MAMIRVDAGHPLTRREFVKLGGQSSGLLAFNHWVPEFLSQTLRSGAVSVAAKARALVLVHLAGGNDGFNTIVPIEDDAYYRFRPTLAVPRQRVIRHSHSVSFHPSASALSQLMEAGKLCVIQGVGYPNPSRNHLYSGRIWETGNDQTVRSLPVITRNPHLDEGFRNSVLRRSVLANRSPGTKLPGVEKSACASKPIYAADGPDCRASEPAVATTPGAGSASAFLQQSKMDTAVPGADASRLLNRCHPRQKYPYTPFAQSLQQVAGQIATGQIAPFYFVSLGGFDTHSNQAGRHAELLSTLSDGLAAFQAHLAEMQLEQQVATLVFSEFGRRARENMNRGTDHGTVAPVFVLSTAIKCPILGRPPRMDDGMNSDPVSGIDFREIYATLIDRWLRGDSARLLGKRYPGLGFL